MAINIPFETGWGMLSALFNPSGKNAQAYRMQAFETPRLQRDVVQQQLKTAKGARKSDKATREFLAGAGDVFGGAPTPQAAEAWMRQQEINNARQRATADQRNATAQNLIQLGNYGYNVPGLSEAALQKAAEMYGISPMTQAAPGAAGPSPEDLAAFRDALAGRKVTPDAVDIFNQQTWQPAAQPEPNLPAGVTPTWSMQAQPMPDTNATAFMGVPKPSPLPQFPGPNKPTWEQAMERPAESSTQDVQPSKRGPEQGRPSYSPFTSSTTQLPAGTSKATISPEVARFLQSTTQQRYSPASTEGLTPAQVSALSQQLTRFYGAPEMQGITPEVLMQLLQYMTLGGQ